jgi:exodeoxyribonuclease-3
MIRLITWNVAGRSRRLVEQAGALAGREPDIVALQEVTRRTHPLWTRALELMGLAHVRSSSLDRSGPGRTLVMIGGRMVLDEAAGPLDLPRPESAVSALAQSAQGPLEVHCVHVPNAANGWVKVQTLRGIRRGFESPSAIPRVLCGDLNTPRRELPDGTTISFARDSRGRLRDDRGPEWDEAELGVVPGLRELGFRDTFRLLNGYAERSPSWTWRTIAGHDGGWRLDHVFASTQLLPIACQYHHGWREEGLSDHAALEVDLEAVRSPARG